MRAQLCSILLASGLLALPACSGMHPDTGPDDTQSDPSGPGNPSNPDDPSNPETPEGPTDTNPALSGLDLPATPYNYANIALPEHFISSLARGFDNTPADNPITNEGATLGRVLFYDTALSKNETVACATCHAQGLAFADSAALSEGFDGGLTGRNSMAAINSRYYLNGRFFWDERADTLEDQVLMPIQNEVEMGLTLEEAVQRVQSQAYYPVLFERAFGDPEINADRMSKALAQFVRSIVSYRSRFDDGMIATGDVNTPFPNFSPQENQGKAVFLGKGGCAACHLDNGPPPPGAPPGPPAQRVNQAFFFIDVATNNGLPILAGDTDLGVGGVTGNPQDTRKFKSSSLRNVTITGPYMHDGRFKDLAEVVEHYDHGVVAQPNLDPRLINPATGQPRQLNLTPGEKQALIAFLGTLSDDELLNDKKYSDPFLQ